MAAPGFPRQQIASGKPFEQQTGKQIVPSGQQCYAQDLVPQGVHKYNATHTQPLSNWLSKRKPWYSQNTADHLSLSQPLPLCTTGVTNEKCSQDLFACSQTEPFVQDPLTESPTVSQQLLLVSEQQQKLQNAMMSLQKQQQDLEMQRQRMLNVNIQCHQTPARNSNIWGFSHSHSGFESTVAELSSSRQSNECKRLSEARVLFPQTSNHADDRDIMQKGVRSQGRARLQMSQNNIPDLDSTQVCSNIPCKSVATPHAKPGSAYSSGVGTSISESLNEQSQTLISSVEDSGIRNEIGSEFAASQEPVTARDIRLSLLTVLSVLRSLPQRLQQLLQDSGALQSHTDEQTKRVLGEVSNHLELLIRAVQGQFDKLRDSTSDVIQQCCTDVSSVQESVGAVLKRLDQHCATHSELLCSTKRLEEFLTGFKKDIELTLTHITDLLKRLVEQSAVTTRSCVCAESQTDTNHRADKASFALAIARVGDAGPEDLGDSLNATPQLTAPHWQRYTDLQQLETRVVAALTEVKTGYFASEARLQNIARQLFKVESNLTLLRSELRNLPSTVLNVYQQMQQEGTSLTRSNSRTAVALPPIPQLGRYAAHQSPVAEVRPWLMTFGNDEARITGNSSQRIFDVPTSCAQPCACNSRGTQKPATVADNEDSELDRSAESQSLLPSVKVETPIIVASYDGAKVIESKMRQATAGIKVQQQESSSSRTNGSRELIKENTRLALPKLMFGKPTEVPASHIPVTDQLSRGTQVVLPAAHTVTTRESEDYVVSKQRASSQCRKMSHPPGLSGPLIKSCLQSSSQFSPDWLVMQKTQIKRCLVHRIKPKNKRSLLETDFTLEDEAMFEIDNESDISV